MPFDPSTIDLSQIPFIQIAFWVMTVCAIGGGIGVVSSRSLFHSAMWLILSLFGVAGYFVLLSAGFLAVVQLMVYIGAIAILVLFAIMFSRSMVTSSGETQNNRQWWLSLPLAFSLFLILMTVATAVNWPVNEAEPSQDTVLQLGLAFLGSYLIPFMGVSVVLSVALIGAIFLARDKTDLEETN
jgi:NADH-quinone oxidoreductase subunit J